MKNQLRITNLPQIQEQDNKYITSSIKKNRLDEIKNTSLKRLHDYQNIQAYKNDKKQDY